MKERSFDVIIIGAGIGGLVTGCYLTQAGLKVLLIEQRKEVGGYCRSFILKNDLRFDACVHSLASCRVGGTLGKIINDLNLKNSLIIIETAIPNIIIFGEKKIRFYRSLGKTIEEFIRSFPNEEANIVSFFRFVSNSDPLLFVRLRNKTFCEFLDGLFKDKSLKRIIERIILISTGVLPKDLSAFIGCSTFKEYVLDSGYYPVGGMQSFSDALAKIVVSTGGLIKRGDKVEEIVLKEGRVAGVLLKKGVFLESPCVVSSSDVYQTFVNLIRDCKVNKYWESKINYMIPSMSAVCLYLSVERDIEKDIDFQSTLYFLNNSLSKDSEESIRDYKRISFLVSCPSLLDKTISNGSRVPVLALTNAFFKSRDFWSLNKKFFVTEIINKLKSEYPEFFKTVSCRGVATPQTLYNWTSNYRGAAYGWAGIPSQLGDIDLKIKNDIKGLYLSGHWITKAHGVISAAYSGKRTAKQILKDCYS